MARPEAGSGLQIQTHSVSNNPQRICVSTFSFELPRHSSLTSDSLMSPTRKLTAAAPPHLRAAASLSRVVLQFRYVPIFFSRSRCIALFHPETPSSSLPLSALPNFVVVPACFFRCCDAAIGLLLFVSLDPSSPAFPSSKSFSRSLPHLLVCFCSSSPFPQPALAPATDPPGGAMEKKKRRGSRQSEGDADTVSSGVEPTLTPPRKRAASLACPPPPALLQPQSQPQPHEDAGVLRITSSDIRIAMDHQNESGPAVPIAPIAMQGLDEPVSGRANPIAAATSLDMTLAFQRQGDKDNNKAMVWSLEQNLPQEAFLPRLLRAYDSFHDRYTRMKARKVDVEAQFEEQRRSHERFQQVADGYIQDLCSENQELRKTVDAAEKRIKWLESLLCQKGEFRACRGSKEEAVQNVNCEADIAVSPVRPLTPKSDEVGAEGAPRQMELHLPSESVRQQREEVAEFGEESVAPVENTENREDLPRELALDNEGSQEIVVTRESEGLQMSTQGNVVLRENALVQGDVEPSPLDGEHQLANTQTTLLEIYASNQVLESPVPEPLLGNSLEDARRPEESAPGDLDNAIVACSEPIIPCRSNGAGFQDLHRKHVELLDAHQKEVAGLLSEVEILQEVLGYFIEMTVVSDKIGRMQRDKPILIFLHSKTGFRFRLEILKVPEEQLEAAKAPELSYKNLSLGSLIGVAPWWMKEEIVFTVDQLVNFLQKFQETVTGIPNNRR